NSFLLDVANQTWTPTGGSSGIMNGSSVMYRPGKVLYSGGAMDVVHSMPSQATAAAIDLTSPSPAWRHVMPMNHARTYHMLTTIPVSTPDASSIAAVNLVSLGADTHQIDMNQHFVPLSYTAGSGSLSIQAPGSAALAPPGYYMLFVLNDKGVPSIARIIRIGQS